LQECNCQCQCQCHCQLLQQQQQQPRCRLQHHAQRTIILNGDQPSVHVDHTHSTIASHANANANADDSAGTSISTSMDNQLQHQNDIGVMSDSDIDIEKSRRGNLSSTWLGGKHICDYGDNTNNNTRTSGSGSTITRRSTCSNAKTLEMEIEERKLEFDTSVLDDGDAVVKGANTSRSEDQEHTQRSLSNLSLLSLSRRSETTRVGLKSNRLKSSIITRPTESSESESCERILDSDLPSNTHKSASLDREEADSMHILASEEDEDEEEEEGQNSSSSSSDGDSGSDADAYGSDPERRPLSKEKKVDTDAVTAKEEEHDTNECMIIIHGPAMDLYDHDHELDLDCLGLADVNGNGNGTQQVRHRTRATGTKNTGCDRLAVGGAGRRRFRRTGATGNNTTTGWDRDNRLAVGNADGHRRFRQNRNVNENQHGTTQQIGRRTGNGTGTGTSTGCDNRLLLLRIRL
jgi:hypothetical protein